MRFSSAISMATDVQPIFELSKKLRGLMDWAIQSNAGALTSVHAVARTTGINRSTLNSNLANEQLSRANQEALAKAFGYHLDWVEWRDTNAARSTPAGQRRDGADDFLNRFSSHKSSGVRLTIEPGLTKVHVDRRFAEFGFVLSGSFEPSAGTNSVPLALSLSFDRRGWPVFRDLTVGLKEVDLQLFHDRPPVAIEFFPLGVRDDAEGNFQGIVAGHSPYWIINIVDNAITRGDQAILAGTRRRNDGKDCICHGFQVGDEIRALMTARVSDCFVRVSGQAFDEASQSKMKFIEHLSKLAALNGAEAVLAEQIMAVVST
jgi:hypothetical protein